MIQIDTTDTVRRADREWLGCRYRAHRFRSTQGERHRTI